MSHLSADHLSDAIDNWLNAERPAVDRFADLLGALDGSLPEVTDELARERVRRRLASYSPRPRSAQQLLLERAVDEIERIQRRVLEEEAIPWGAVGAGAIIMVGALAAVVYLRRRGIDPVVGGA